MLKMVKITTRTTEIITKMKTKTTLAKKKKKKTNFLKRGVFFSLPP